MTLGELLRTITDSVVDWFSSPFRLFEHFTTADDVGAVLNAEITEYISASSAIMLVFVVIANIWAALKAREDRNRVAFWGKQRCERHGGSMAGFVVLHDKVVPSLTIS